MKRTHIFMNELVYLNLFIFEISKMVILEFWFDYLKLKYEEKAKLCEMDTDGFIVYIETKHIYFDIAKDFKTTFDTLNY